MDHETEVKRLESLILKMVKKEGQMTSSELLNKIVKEEIKSKADIDIQSLLLSIREASWHLIANHRLELTSERKLKLPEQKTGL